MAGGDGREDFCISEEQNLGKMYVTQREDENRLQNGRFQLNFMQMEPLKDTKQDS